MNVKMGGYSRLCSTLATTQQDSRAVIPERDLFFRETILVYLELSDENARGARSHQIDRYRVKNLPLRQTLSSIGQSMKLNNLQ